MLPIIKIYHQGEKDVTKHIYVFLNNNWIEDNILSLEDSLRELHREAEKKETASLKFIFHEKELREIYEKDIPITFFAETLHLDDTIMTIKGKIIEHTELSLSLPEIYLYGVHKEKLKFQTLYKNLHKMRKSPLRVNDYFNFYKTLYDLILIISHQKKMSFIKIYYPTQNYQN